MGLEELTSTPSTTTHVEHTPRVVAVAAANAESSVAPNAVTPFKTREKELSKYVGTSAVVWARVGSAVGVKCGTSVG